MNVLQTLLCCEGRVARNIMWEFNMREFLNFFYNFRWLISLCKLQGIQIVNILEQLLFLARTDTGGAQVVSGASLATADTQALTRTMPQRRVLDFLLQMSVAATVGMALKDTIPWSGLSTSCSSATFVRNAP